jgi:hypothetical protein
MAESPSRIGVGVTRVSNREPFYVIFGPPLRMLRKFKAYFFWRSAGTKVAPFPLVIERCVPEDVEVRSSWSLMLLLSLWLSSNVSFGESVAHAPQAPVGISAPAVSQSKMQWTWDPSSRCMVGRLVGGASAPQPIALGDVAPKVERDPAESLLMKPLTCPGVCAANYDPKKCTALKKDSDGNLVNLPENRYTRSGSNLCMALSSLCSAAKEAKIDPSRLMVTSCE